MRIEFDHSDFNIFFNMISVYKTYAEIADKVDIEPPSSAIDLLLHELASLVMEHAWYTSTFLENENLCFAVIQFMLGTAKIKVDEDVAKAFNIPGQALDIDIKSLWNYLVENGV